MIMEELRIGNLIRNSENEVIQVLGLVRTKNEECVVHSYGGQFTYMEELSGMTLTVEHLIMYDFIYHDTDENAGYWQREHITVFEDEDGSFAFDGFVYIEYFHQLQNCYFEFTGSEL